MRTRLSPFALEQKIKRVEALLAGRDKVARQQRTAERKMAKAARQRARDEEYYRSEARYDLLQKALVAYARQFPGHFHYEDLVYDQLDNIVAVKGYR